MLCAVGFPIQIDETSASDPPDATRGDGRPNMDEVELQMLVSLLLSRLLWADKIAVEIAIERETRYRERRSVPVRYNFWLQVQCS